ncbi:hypothetical protein [Spirosoma agri]|uniref:Uncharacterized protein n=1 Tax=Spirosoma agri TaxID=1987381 RepID=A0A6M0IMW3_9BACT|nr:hypothetical protein [Spirosoma agri]NEU69666.1 hypothetical protein [Spirosoma agri]
MALNESLTFDQLATSVRQSFNGLIARHEQIRAGTLLYKFTDWDVFNPTGRASPYWGTMEDLFDILYYSKRTGRTLLECVRQRNAVLHNWNGLNSLLIVRISQDVYGFTGTIGPQTEKGYGKDGVTYSRHFTSQIALWGGASQVYLPGLQRSHITEVVSAETVLIRDDTDAILDFLTSMVLA